MINTAVLVDGSFFLKRYFAIDVNNKRKQPADVAKDIHALALKHVDKKEGESLYRIFYYDCFPYQKKHHNPITKEAIDFSRTETAQWRAELFEELKKKRKVALRLGYLKVRDGWIIRPAKTKLLLDRKIDVCDLGEHDVYLDLIQKGVDIRIGTDIASLTLKKQVNRIVLISGDSDFVPASKLARREGVDFVLDPMWNNISPELFEHIDGLQSTIAKPAPGTRERR